VRPPGPSRPGAGWLIGIGLALASARAQALDLTGGSAAARGCPRGPPQLHLGAAAYLEPAPILYATRYGGRYYRPAAGNNIGFATAFGEVSARVGSFCVGLVAREEWDAHATRDLLDAVVANHDGKPFDTGRAYRLAYQLQMFQAAGIRLRRVLTLVRSPAGRLQLGIGVSLLRATQGRQEWGYGSATATAADYAVGTAAWTRIDSTGLSGFNPFVGRPHPSGWGYATDLELRAALRTGTAVDLVIMDPESRIHWRDIGDSVRSFDDATVRYNADLNRDALLTGSDSRVSRIERLPVEYRLTVDQSVAAKWRLQLADDLIEGYHFPAVGARYGSPIRFIGTGFDARTRAVAISVGWHGLEASVATNRFPLSEATALAASLELSRLW
jgi:hypothetical protein